MMSDFSSAPSPWLIWKTRRYVVAFLGFFGFFTCYALRVNLSVAIVAMTELKNITLENGTTKLVKEFDWDSKIQGYVLSSFFYGYVVTPLVGGFAATKFGGRTVFGIGIGVTAFLTIITPFAVKSSVYLFIVVRILEGLFEGVTYPSMHAVWSKWAPPLERSKLAMIAVSGSYVGTVVAMPVCSLLATTLGWESIFYVFGAFGVLWSVLWMTLIAETPENDSSISQYELKYITQAINEHKTTPLEHIPWRSFFTSMPVWAIIVANFVENWGFYTTLTQVPTFMKYVLHFDMNSVGFVSSLPYLACSITVQLAGQLADFLRRRKIMTTTEVRKFLNCGAFVFQTIFMLLAAFLMTPVGTTICLTIAIGFGGMALAGFLVNHLDIAPQFASILFGISNSIGSVPGIISPILTGYIVTDTTSADQWRVVFYVASAIYIFGTLFYGFFASGELQSWASHKEEDDEKPDDKNGGGKANLSFQTDTF
ncbi:unnamed protein product [Phaedon cochleariae]|uniref:Sialin n=1 Tax=Phaedon cochleariae TaxID=80249 RepID=A0A9N9SBW4_PHACE|nr:unnamed protein product [Phaedon cochleariae]